MRVRSVGEFQQIMETVGKVVDAAGVTLSCLGAAVVTVVAGGALLRRRADEDIYRRYRRSLGRSILLGLELLAAAVTIRTVVVAPRSSQSAFSA